MNSQSFNQPVILFDGVCNLCNASVQFIILRDPDAVFRFTSLQSDEGVKLLKKINLPSDQLQTIILIEEEKAYSRSTAALKIAKKLNGLWPVLYSFIVVPPFIRDSVYNLIARNRYKWFGQQNECMIPTPELRSRFL